jgi:hypothetical protein
LAVLQTRRKVIVIARLEFEHGLKPLDAWAPRPSAAAGAHGINGFNAAEAVLRTLF